jgi:phenylacetate-CoA ligase
MGMFSLLKQREYRWFRFDPTKKLVMIRGQDNFPTGKNSYLQKQQTYHYPQWPYIGELTATGTASGFLHSNTIADTIDWLWEQQADYVITYAATLEMLALSFGEQARDLGLNGILGISTLMTPAVRKLAEEGFQCGVQQNYGLNEIGIVASRCPQGGRYHVHSEHCLVEIVDQNGVQVKDGEQGKLLVTSLDNTAMPLIRYDTGDLAIAASGPCQCGRTLPTFLAPTGRYRSHVFLPENTWSRWMGLQNSINHMSPQQRHGLQQYQVHQTRDKNFRMRMVCSENRQQHFKKFMEVAWEPLSEQGKYNLSIEFIDSIEAASWGKYENFSSEYMPAADENWHENPPEWLTKS